MHHAHSALAEPAVKRISLAESGVEPDGQTASLALVRLKSRALIGGMITGAPDADDRFEPAHAQFIPRSSSDLSKRPVWRALRAR